jgi:hypothetical protein
VFGSSAAVHFPAFVVMTIFRALYENVTGGGAFDVSLTFHVSLLPAEGSCILLRMSGEPLEI